MTSGSVLITGAGNGIGAATAHAFAEVGLDVVVTDLDPVAAHNVATILLGQGKAASGHLLDVSSTKSWEELAITLRAQQRLPSIIVNNAFLQIRGAAHEITEAQWNEQLSVSLTSVYRSLHTFHESLRSTNGSVVNVSSVHAQVARPGRPAYAAAKGGMVALTRQLSIDYAPLVRVNCVIPGAIKTRVWDEGSDDEAAARLISLARLGRPDEVASVIRFLASEDASYVTGATLVVDGGQSVRAEL